MSEFSETSTEVIRHPLVLLRDMVIFPGELLVRALTGWPSWVMAVDHPIRFSLTPSGADLNL